jgi:hypothetical protein
MPPSTPAPVPPSTSAPWHLCTPALIALAYAILDEVHQEFVPQRGFELSDIGMDLLGILFAMGLIHKHIPWKSVPFCGWEKRGHRQALKDTDSYEPQKNTERHR